MKLDSERVWIALVEEQHVDGQAASRIFTRFLQRIVQSFYVTKLSLGPEEYVRVRGVQSAKTICGQWKTLHGAAKLKVFDPLVKLYPERRYNFLELEGLTPKQTFTKEATPEDVMLISFVPYGPALPTSLAVLVIAPGSMQPSSSGGIRGTVQEPSLSPGHVFETPFKCPKCRLSEGGHIEIENVIYWSSHTESVHRLKCSPTPPPGARER
ncbi:hypothetical protein F4809DRAFT_636791 [Biscogniauxia mediterranea]|nr:hypothetical protein F4809DRAFT_636791 [Biscogniauxia mediterranea]